MLRFLMLCAFLFANQKQFSTALQQNEYPELQETSQTFTAKPRNTSVLIGQDAVLHCGFSTPAPHCFWMVDNDIIVVKGRYSFIGNKDEGNCSIRITNVTHYDDGWWKCGYPRTDSEGMLKTSRSYLLAMVAPEKPVFVINGIAIKDGDKLYLNLQNFHQQLPVSCWSENGNPATSITWRITGHVYSGILTQNGYHQYNKVYINKVHPFLKTAYSPLELKRHGIDERWQQHNITCIASHPAYSNGSLSTSVQLIIAY